MLSFIRFASKSTKSFRSNRSLQRLKKVRQDKTMNEFGPNPGLDNSINSIRNANIKLDEEIIQEVVDEDTINPYGVCILLLYTYHLYRYENT